MRQETLYEPLISGLSYGLSSIPPEMFRPTPGTILILVPPPEERTDGGLALPDRVQKSPPIAKVISVPSDPECPVSPGDWVIYRQDQPTPIPFMGRKDLAILQYADDASSEIFGYFPELEMDRLLESLQPV